MLTRVRCLVDRDGEGAVNRSVRCLVVDRDRRARCLVVNRDRRVRCLVNSRVRCLAVDRDREGVASRRVRWLVMDRDRTGVVVAGVMDRAAGTCQKSKKSGEHTCRQSRLYGCLTGPLAVYTKTTEQSAINKYFKHSLKKLLHYPSGNHHASHF